MSNEEPDRGVDRAIVQALDGGRAELAAIDGVKGFDIGLDDDGAHTIRVLVEDPDNPPDGVPERIGGYAVRIVRGAPKLCFEDTGRYDPALGGCAVAQAASFGVVPAPTGTLGIVMRDAQSLEPVGVSCTHVLGGTDPTAIFLQTEIWQPNALGQRLGALLRWEIPLLPPFVPGGFPTGFWDAAVCTLDRAASVGEILEIGQVTGIGSARIGDIVRKRGISTGLRHGKVTGLFGSYLIGHPGLATGWWMLGQVEITALTADELRERGLPPNPDGFFAIEGDSGSAAVNEAGELVGLVHAGGIGPTAYAMDFGPMAIALGIVL